MCDRAILLPALTKVGKMSDGIGSTDSTVRGFIL